MDSSFSYSYSLRRLGHNTLVEVVTAGELQREAQNDGPWSRRLLELELIGDPGQSVLDGDSISLVHIRNKGYVTKRPEIVTDGR